MEGHSHHSGSHSYAPPPQSPASFHKVTANAGGGGGFGAPPSAPRAEQFSEMFKACSLPTLDLPPNDDSASAFDFVYSEIFGGFDFTDFAVSFDQLFSRSDGTEDSSDDARTQVGTEPLPEDADPSACSGRNHYFQNGGFHQTTESKVNASYHKVNRGEDLNPVHVAELSAVPENSYIYDSEGSNLQKEVEERYSSEVADDVILHEDSSGSIFAEVQLKTASNPSILSHGSGGKAGRPHGINLSPTGICVSDDSPPTSRPPPTVVDTKKDPASSVSDFERPKGNAAKALFDIGSLDFLNVEFDTGSSAIASAAAIKEAMDRAKVKLESARESTERKKDDAKGTRPVMKNDMKGVEKVRNDMKEGSIARTDELQREHESECNLFEISRKGMQDISEASRVLPYHLQVEDTHNGATKRPQSMVTKNQDSSDYPKVDEKSRKRDNEVCEKDANETKLEEAEKRTVSAHDLAKKSLKLKRSNTNKFGDEEAEEERERTMQESKLENVENMCEVSPMDEEKKMDKGDLHADLKSTKSEYSTSSIGPSSLDVRNNKAPEMTCEFEGLKSSNLAARLVEEIIKSTAVACEDAETLKDHAAEFMIVDEEKGKYRSGTFFGDVESNVAEREDICMSTKYLQMTEADRPMMTEEREREIKLEKLHHKRPEELRERERENELDKNRVSKIEEERHNEREKELKKERLRKLVNERKRERERKKDSIVVELTTSVANERASAETHEGADRAAVETAAAEARQRAMAEARERLEKACAEARGKSFSEKSSTEARLRAERAAVLRANAEARERAIEKAMAERATFEAREQVERFASEKFSPPLRDMKLRHTSSSSDMWHSDKSNEVEGESAQRCRSSLERHCRTVERVAKALAEKNMRDHNAQKEEAEKNRLAESLDADIKRWSSGKEGNLRALLSTLQYILGPNSGWHPIPLTEVISSAAVKKAYRKATLCVHPDKLQQRGATIQQKYICEKVFDLLQDSWNRFSSEER